MQTFLKITPPTLPNLTLRNPVIPALPASLKGLRTITSPSLAIAEWGNWDPPRSCK